jgi:hypothetical protein
VGTNGTRVPPVLAVRGGPTNMGGRHTSSPQEPDLTQIWANRPRDSAPKTRIRKRPAAAGLARAGVRRWANRGWGSTGGIGWRIRDKKKVNNRIVGLCLIRFLGVELTHSDLNIRFDMGVVFMSNYFYSERQYFH